MLKILEKILDILEILEYTTLLEKIRLISKFMTSQLGKNNCNICILRSKDNQIMIFG